MDKNKILITLSERGRFWKVPFENLSEAEQIFRAIWDLESEVNNGGFYQYYYNNSGDTACHVVAALEEIGAEAAAGIVAKANAAFYPVSPSIEQDVRREQLEVIESKYEDLWDSLDEEFFSYPDDLTGLLYDYVKRNKSEIEGARNVGI